MRLKIIGITMLMVLLPMFFSAFYFYTEFSKALIRNTYDNLERQIRQTTENITLSYSILNNSSLHFFSNKNIREWLSGEWSLEGNPLDLLKKKLQLEADLKYSMLFNNAWDMKLVNTAYFFLDGETFVSVSRAPINPEVLAENNLAAYGKISRIPARGVVCLPPTARDHTLYLSRTISRVDEPDVFLSLLIGTDENVFAAKYQDLLTYPGSLAYVVDDRGIIFSSSGKDLLGEPVDRVFQGNRPASGVTELTLDGEVYLMASERIGDSGLTFIFALPKGQIREALSGSMLKYLLMTLLMMAVFLTISLLASLMFTGFIKTLLSGILRVKSGDYEAKMPAYGDPDLNLISETFNNMTGEINYLVKEVYEKQLLLKETDIRFLQSQMNPHFLFNVLVTIGIKAKMSKDETIYQMINSLSELLQAGIYGTGPMHTTLGKELEYVRFYLYLQKMRFEDKLEYEIRVADPALLESLIPRLCVEPLVENAVVHGLEAKSDGGTVCVDIRQDGMTLVIEIRDNGLGFQTEDFSPDFPSGGMEKDRMPEYGPQNASDDKKELEKNGAENFDPRRHNRISLQNTNRRLKLMYGELYGVAVESEPGKGASVTVRIPVEMEEKTDAECHDRR